MEPGITAVTFVIDGAWLLGGQPCEVMEETPSVYGDIIRSLFFPAGNTIAMPTENFSSAPPPPEPAGNTANPGEHTVSNRFGEYRITFKPIGKEIREDPKPVQPL